MVSFSKFTSRGEQELEKPSFFSYVYSFYNKINNMDWDSQEFQGLFRENFYCFPYFPDIDLINELSYEKYERKDCNVNLVFLPFDTLCAKNEDNPLIFSFADKEMSFEKKQIRLIRKVAESSDNDHALVLCCNEDGIYYFNGIINESEICEKLSNYYFISITGSSHWSVRCKNFNLFDYKNGYFCDFRNSDKDFDEQAEDVINCFKKSSFKTDPNQLKKIMATIKEQKHGTCFVVFKDDKEARAETKRLCNAQRGFKAEKPLGYEEFVKCIPQFTKVDGGILLDDELTCYAYGCIFDGVVKDSFKGSLASGSRFNSTALYTYTRNHASTDNDPIDKEKQPDMEQESTICLGVVFSDDGGVKIAEIK